MTINRTEINENMNFTSNHRMLGMRQSVRVALLLSATIVISACGSSDDDASSAADPAVDPIVSPVVTTRASGMTLTVQDANGVKVHSLTAPESVFANSTHIIETENSLIAFDTQFLLPNAQDMRDYADEIGKPIDRVFISHDHPDHFLGSEVFNDRPVYALQETSDLIMQNGDAEVAEKQGDFGAESIAGTYVVPEIVEPGSIEIDGVMFELVKVLDAEASIQLVVRLPDHGVVLTGDIVYSGVHLIMAGQPATWIPALNGLAATSEQYPIVLAGHGVPVDLSASSEPADPSVYDTNIQWLTKAAELISTVDNSDDFRQGLIDAFPNLGMAAAIDFVIPFLFPNE